MTTTTHQLSPEQCQHLRDQGYLMVPNLIDTATIDGVRQELNEVVDATAHAMKSEGQLVDTHSDAGFDRQLARIAHDSMDTASKLIARIEGDAGSGGHMGPGVFELLRHPCLLDAIESLVGPEIIGSSVYRIRPKVPGLIRGAVPWHQDSGYLMGHCDRELIITCWIPLVDATIENGCLYVIPQVHKNGIMKHHTGGSANYLVIKDEDIPGDTTPIAVPVPKGGVLFMTNLTPHASFTNASDHVRWSVDLRYQNANTPHNADLLPSESKSDSADVEIACYPPEADFVLRSPSQPNKEIRDWQTLKQLRDRHFINRHTNQIPFPDRWPSLKA